MQTYKIAVQEQLTRIVEIQSDSEKKAIGMVKEMYQNEDIVLDYSDLSDIDIFSNSKGKENKAREKEGLIKEIIDYLYKDERTHYLLCEPDDRKNHIFNKIMRLNELSKD